MAAHRSPELRSTAVAIFFNFDPVLITDFLYLFSSQDSNFGEFNRWRLPMILAPDEEPPGISPVTGTWTLSFLATGDGLQAV
jgi:hypothetical protein